MLSYCLYIWIFKRIILELNQIDYYSVVESLLGHRNDTQIWIVGAIHYRNRDFRIEGVLNRDSITAYVPAGSNIVADQWEGYNFLDYNNSGYTYFTHSHGDGDFGMGIESTSFIGSLWSILKQKKKVLII